MSTPLVSELPPEEVPQVAAEVLDTPRAEDAGPLPAVSASAWIIGNYFCVLFLRLVGNITLSRFLEPATFGLMTLVSTLLLGLEMFSALGVGPTIIQSRRGDELPFLNTAWTIQIGRGFMLFLAACLLGIPAAYFYKDPELVYLLPAAGLGSLLAGFNATSLYTAARHLRIGPVVIYEVTASFLGLVVMCVWAWISPSVWALLAGNLATAVIRLFCSHFLLPGGKNRLAWEPAARHEFLHFGKWIFLGTVVTFFGMQGDRLVLGKLVSLSALGLYGVGLAIAAMPELLMSNLCANVLYSVLAKAARQARDTLPTILHEARETLLSISMVFVLAVSFEAENFFHLCYNDRYQNAGLVTTYLTAWVWVRVLSATLDRTLLALGDSRSLAFFEFVRAVTSLVAAAVGYYVAEYLGSTMPLTGFIVGLTLGALCGHLVLLWLIARHGIRVASQDLRYTALILGIGILGHLALFAASDLQLVWRIVIPTAIVVCVGIGPATKTYRLIKRQQMSGTALDVA